MVASEGRGGLHGGWVDECAWIWRRRIARRCSTTATRLRATPLSTSRRNRRFAYVISDKQTDTPEAAIAGAEDDRQRLGCVCDEGWLQGEWGGVSGGVVGDSDGPGFLCDGEGVVRAAEVSRRDRERSTSKSIDLPYDVTGWTLPLQMGVNVDAVTDPLGCRAARACWRRLTRRRQLARGRGGSRHGASR